MEKNIQPQNGWTKRVLAAVCDHALNWIVCAEFGVSPYESNLFLSYGSHGWEEAYMQGTMTRLQQTQGEEV